MFGVSFQMLQLIMDVTVAGISLMLGLGFFFFVASVLCSAAFFQNSKVAS